MESQSVVNDKIVEVFQAVAKEITDLRARVGILEAQCKGMPVSHDIAKEELAKAVERLA